MRRRTWALAVGLLALVIPGAATAAPNAGWQEITHPQIGGKDELLQDVAAVADDDVWAVGYNQAAVGGSYEFRTHVLHWDGAAWALSPSRDVEGAPATNLLYGIGASAPNDVWIVGWHREPASISKTLIERWDGTAWTIVTSPNPSASGNYLKAVAASSTASAWAVGTAIDPSVSDEGPLALRWDGGAWTVSPLPTVTGCTAHGALTDVVALAVDDAIATGWCENTGNRDVGYVLRWRSGAWTVLHSRATGVIVSTHLTTVAATGIDNVWAMGDRIRGQTSAPYILHFDGVGWTSMSAPRVNDVPQILGSAARPDGHAWAVGLTNDEGTPFAVRMTLSYDGTRWRQAESPGYSRVTGVAYEPSGTAWAVGFDLGDSLINDAVTGPVAGDVMGALLDALAAGGAPVEVIERDDGRVRTGNPAYYLSPYETWTPGEQWACDSALGKVLDLGCGAGRHAAVLVERGLEVDAIDTSLGAVRHAQAAGVRGARVASIHELPLDLSGHDTYLLLGFNLGLLCDRDAGPAVLRSLAARAAPGAVVYGQSGLLGELDDVDAAYRDANVAAGRLPGVAILRQRYSNLATPWFQYGFMAPADLAELAAGTGWDLHEVRGDEVYVARLRRQG